MISGWIDLAAGPAALNKPAGSPPSPGDMARIAAAGCELNATGPHAGLAADGTRLVLVEGRPRFADPAIERLARERGAAAAWLESWRTRPLPAFDRVAGSYAVVLIDLELKRAALACDRFAIQGLYYGREGGMLRFAGRADAKLAGSASGIDLQALYDYLYFHVIPAPRTVFRGVRRVPGAGLVIVDPAAVSEGFHWTPEFREERRASFAERREEFPGLVRGAVLRETGGGPVGAFLSGGTDSSTVAGMLGKVTGQPASTWSIGFAAQGYDEVEYARITARHFGTDHHEYYVTPEDLVAAIPRVARYYDQPFGNSSALPTYYCGKVAAEAGVGKLLAGDGGDELFGGNTRYATQRLFGAYGQIPGFLRRGLLEPLLADAAWPKSVPLLRKAARYVEQARVPMPDRMETYNLLDWLGAEKVLEDGFRTAVDLRDPARQQRETWARVRAPLIDAMLAYDWKFTLADNDLPKVCGTAALAGIDVGFPLLADEIVDFSLRLPVSWKLRGLTLRWFFKQALRGFLADATLTKKKHGFGLPFGPWFMSHPPLRALATESVQAFGRRGIVRPAFVAELVGRRMPEHPHFYGGMVWVLMMLEQWLQDHDAGFGVEGSAG